MPAIFLEVRHVFEKRDNMGYPIHPLLIVFFAVLGAGFLVACGFAIHSSYHRGTEDDAPSRSIAQEQYMQKVRARNLDDIMAQSARMGYYRTRRAPLR
jgi:hypothetical protein